MDALVLDRAKRLYEATRSLPFADLPTVDLKDRLSVVSVGAGLRTVGVLETWGQRLTQTRDRMIQCGLATAVTTCVWNRIERPDDVLHRDVLFALDERRVLGKPKHVLWLYPSTTDREQLRQPSYTQQEAGRLLGYPACCIAFESGVMQLLPAAQLDALIARVGDDKAKLLAAARSGDLPETRRPKLPDNALRTEQTLPFVLHVACDACLNDANSPSELINRRNAELARAVDAEFHALFVVLQQTYCQITGDADKDRNLLARVRTLHANFLGRSR